MQSNKKTYLYRHKFNYFTNFCVGFSSLLVSFLSLLLLIHVAAISNCENTFESLE